jgi:hypothetical protein
MKALNISEELFYINVYKDQEPFIIHKLNETEEFLKTTDKTIKFYEDIEEKKV